MPSELRLNIYFPDMANKNLRSKKGPEATNDLAEDNLEQIRLLIASLAEKIDKLDADGRRRHDAIYGKLEHLEERTNTLFEDVGEMKMGLGSVNSRRFKTGIGRQSRQEYRGKIVGED